jgi:HEAT repeat protein
MSSQYAGTTASERAFEALITDLASDNTHVRAQARRELAERGVVATEPLIELLEQATAPVRWEAAKTLVALHDPAAIDALISALDDTNRSIRWLAAEGLIAIGYASVRPLLRAILTHGGDPLLLEGAQHVLHTICQEATQPVVAALEGPVASLEAPLAAFYALEQIGW